MLLSELQQFVQQQPWLSYRVVFKDATHTFHNFTTSVIRGRVPRKLPTSNNSNQYNQARYEQMLMIQTVDIESPLLVSDLLAITTEPPTDLEITFRIGDGAHFTPVIVSFVNDKGIATFNT